MESACVKLELTLPLTVTLESGKRHSPPRVKPSQTTPEGLVLALV